MPDYVLALDRVARPAALQGPGSTVSYVLLLDGRPQPVALRKQTGPSMVGVVLKIGPRGIQGDPGLNAYELAQANGFTGTLTQWLDTLRGFIRLAPGVTTPPVGTPDGTFVFQEV